MVPAGARVLDFAAGQGRHARHFASLGHRVLAVDIDAGALAGLHGVAGVTVRTADLEAGDLPFRDERFGAIVVTHYLHRPSLGALLDLLADDGILIYETFAAGNEAYGRPSNPAFLLGRGELLDCVRGRLGVIAFEEGVVDRPGGGRAVVQRLAAAGPRHPAPWRLPGTDAQPGDRMR